MGLSKLNIYIKNKTAEDLWESVMKNKTLECALKCSKNLLELILGFCTCKAKKLAKPK